MSDKLFTTLEQGKSPIGDTYSWTAAERFWSPKDRAWFVSYSFFFVAVISLAVVLGYSLFQNGIGTWLFILAIISFAFLWFIQASIPPQRITHTVNSLGIKSFGKLYKWKEIAHYWFSEKHGIRFLHLDLFDESNPLREAHPRLSLLIENNEDLDLFFLLISKLDYGDKSEVGYNIFAKFIHGKYIPMTDYLPDEVPTQEEYLESLNTPATNEEAHNSSKAEKKQKKH